MAGGVLLLNRLTGWFLPYAMLAALAGPVFTPAAMASAELFLLIPLLLVTACLALLEGHPITFYGLSRLHRWQLGLQGLAWGIGALALLMLILALTGHAALHYAGLALPQAAAFALAWLAASLVVGFAEEFAFRGYFYTCLATPYGPLPAALVTSLCFAAAHAGNGGESFNGLADCFLGGLLFALALHRTGSLWWAIGFHTGWDYAENFLFGTPDSGQSCAGTLFQTLPLGAGWASGGSTGPEGSVFAIGLDIAVLAAAWFTLPRAR